MPERVAPLPTLTGERVTLRPLTDSEREPMARAIAADPESGPRWSTNPETMVRWFCDRDVNYLVIEMADETVGVIDFTEVLDAAYFSAGIDIALFSSCVGRGVGTEALRVLATWLIDVRGHHRLTIDPAADNARAIHAYEKIGFRPIGIAREYEQGSDGTWHNNLLMDMLAEDLVRS